MRSSDALACFWRPRGSPGPASRGRVPCITKMRYPMGAPERGCCGGRAPADSAEPAAGDWLSGRAPRSHRGGHWFDPSIAHRCKTRSETPLTALILLDGWELSPYWEESGRSCSPARVAGQPARRPQPRDSCTRLRTCAGRLSEIASDLRQFRPGRAQRPTAMLAWSAW